ncbi:MAG: fructose-6-phosphate aldolase [Alphaproteobacteria bacterium]|nr:MAG: fructose-6-phosphate aldolase [Alphaproteobacteria bacterium]
MKIFLDSSDIAEINNFKTAGLLKGVTTNPKLVSNFAQVLELNKLTDLKISYQPKIQNLNEEIETIIKHKDNIILKIAPRFCDFCLVSELRKLGLEINLTLAFNLNQAVLAANLGAKYVSIFVGRLEDDGYDPFAVIEQIRTIYDRNGISTEIIAASIRNVEHVRKSVLSGAHIITAKPSIIYELFEHELTTKGIIDFAK